MSATRTDTVPPAAGGLSTEELLTYLLLDGENIDATLGNNVLNRRPNPEERPRWNLVFDFARRVWDCPVKGLFFLNASNGNLPMPFLQALHAIGFRPIPLAGPPGIKVVDVGIQRTLEALAERPGNVLLGSHDVDFHDQIEALLDGKRRVGLLAFREFVSLRYGDLQAAGLEVYDLEDDARCFTQVLPRTRIIDIDDFDPTRFL